MPSVLAVMPAAIIQVGVAHRHQATIQPRYVLHCGGRCQLGRPFTGRQLAQLMALDGEMR